MAANQNNLPPLPLEDNHWQAVVDVLELSPREAEVAALKIRGAQLKQISSHLGIAISSIRNLESRILAKAGVRRHEFFAHILRVSHAVRPCSCGQNRPHSNDDPQMPTDGIP